MQAVARGHAEPLGSISEPASDALTVVFEAIPAAELLTVPAADHNVPLQQPRMLTEAIRGLLGGDEARVAQVGKRPTPRASTNLCNTWQAKIVAMHYAQSVDNDLKRIQALAQRASATRPLRPRRND